MVILFTILFAILMSFSFAPLSLWFAAPLAVGLLIYSLQRVHLKQRLALVYLFAFISNAIILHWTSTYVGALPWLILSFLESLFLLPIALVFPLRGWRYPALASLWVALESLMARYPFGGFGWTRIGFTQADAPYKSLASIGGAPALTFTTVLVGIILFAILSKNTAKALLLTLGISVLTLTGLTVASSDHIQSPGKISILAIQGGVPELGLDFNSRAKQVFQNHLSETYRTLASTKEHPDLLLWPENSIDVDPFTNQDVKSALDELANRSNTPIIFGAVRTVPTGYANVSVLWNPTTGPATIYTKIHLTPFGEYIPMRSIANKISPLANDVVDFIPGTQNISHHVGLASIGPVICYELLDDSLLRKVAQNSNIFAVQTNSATFGKSAQSKQELAISRIRAIEHHRNIISISTSGVSAFIDINGAITQETKLDSAASIQKSVELSNGSTFSDKMGWRGEWILIFIPTLAWFIVSRVRLKRS